MVMKSPGKCTGKWKTIFIIIYYTLGMHRSSADYYAGIGRLLFTMYYDGIGC